MTDHDDRDDGILDRISVGSCLLVAVVGCVLLYEFGLIAIDIIFS